MPSYVPRKTTRRADTVNAWSPAEVLWLRTAWEMGAPLARIVAGLPRHTRNSILGKRSTLGLPVRPRYNLAPHANNRSNAYARTDIRP